jgi:predicted pyridoxine 5'-phosphate oxidase superfamily flavin-nucleotide-binding protein
MKIREKAALLLKAREFINLATADKSGNPNSAPKFLLKVDGSLAHFIDYSIGKTADNLRVNPKVSFSLVDVDTLIGYKINGKAEIIESGKAYDDCLKELSSRKIKLSVERIIKGVHADKAHNDFELAIPEHILVYRVKFEDVVEITPRGELRRET